MVIKALATWVDLGVLKEDPENTFVLLEREEQASSSIIVRDYPAMGEFLFLSAVLESGDLYNQIMSRSKCLQSNNNKPNKCVFTGG